MIDLDKRKILWFSLVVFLVVGCGCNFCLVWENSSYSLFPLLRLSITDNQTVTLTSLNTWFAKHSFFAKKEEFFYLNIFVSPIIEKQILNIELAKKKRFGEIFWVGKTIFDHICIPFLFHNHICHVGGRRRKKTWSQSYNRYLVPKKTK